MNAPHDNSCHVCGETGLEEFPAFRQLRRVTSDCRPWPAGGRLCLCTRCGCVQKITDESWHGEIGEIYRTYAIYHQAAGVEQAVFEQSSGSSVSRSQQLLSALGEQVRLPETGRMLDVGCGNGAMLRAFSRVAPRWSLAGTELSDRHRALIAGIEHTEPLYTCPPEQVPGTFDLVTMVHVLEHIPDPREFLVAIGPKLFDGGLLVVQLPHHVDNPFELLIADHCTHFSAVTAAGLFAATGFDVVTVADDWVPRELTVVARKQSPPHSPSIPPVDPASARQCVARRLQWLEGIAATARKLVDPKRLGLFGTSIAATWLFGELDEAVGFFVDEDANRIGKTCLGRPIYAPGQIPPGSHVFVPLAGGVAERIVQRLARPAVTFHLPPVM
jgi:2-polyprenyl-3-methyl-5-hydroxy-6-metoxy-1,4-benzoquinol methylase